MRRLPWFLRRPAYRSDPAYRQAQQQLRDARALLAAVQESAAGLLTPAELTNVLNDLQAHLIGIPSAKNEAPASTEAPRTHPNHP